MTKDLSRQLCELAGIEEKKICSKCGYYMTGCKDGDEWEECSSGMFYPNFETPENFVRLLECGFKCGYALHTDKFNRTKSFVENVLEATIYVLGNDCRGDFKQTLQTTGWVY